jgi:hypothetical protein
MDLAPGAKVTKGIVIVRFAGTVTAFSKEVFSLKIVTSTVDALKPLFAKTNLDLLATSALAPTKNCFACGERQSAPPAQIPDLEIQVKALTPCPSTIIESVLVNSRVVFAGFRVIRFLNSGLTNLVLLFREICELVLLPTTGQITGG